jgi:hypothetical protein
VPDDYNKIVPDHRIIYKFMKNLFTAAQLTAECAIVTLVNNFKYFRRKNIKIKIFLKF